MRCDGPNWGEHQDWCVLHEQDPLLCVALDRGVLENENRILRKAADVGAKSIKLWLKEGCGCEPEGHVCGIRDVRDALGIIEEALQMPGVHEAAPGDPHGDRHNPRKSGASDLHERITVREACRRRAPLGGVDAQALEHGMTQLEQEKEALKKQYDDLAFKIQMMKLEHPDGCVQAGMMLKREMEVVNLELSSLREAVSALLKAPHNSFDDAACREKVKGLL